jgi:hypothetical protein
MANLSLNPMATTNALGSFGVQSDGLIQGVALDDPPTGLTWSGTVASTETNPMWGGLPVAELLPGTASSPKGSTIRRAASVSELEGFTVFNQAQRPDHAAIPCTAVCIWYERLVLPDRINMRVPLKASSAVVALGTTGASVKTPLAWTSLTAS